MIEQKKAIVLLNMGGINNLEEVEVFLTNMFNDKNIITVKSSLLRSLIAKMIVFTRAEKSQEIYKKIGCKSPLVDITRELVAKLQAKVGDGVMVDFAMRYTPPFADEVVARLNDAKVSDIYLIPLYPQYSTTTTKSSLEDFYESYHRGGGGAIISQIEHFFQNSIYNDAIVQMIKEQIGREESAEFDLIFSAHGLPVKVIKKGDVYERQINRHVEILTQKFVNAEYKFNNVHLAYQSKVGPMEWLKPSLEDKLQELKNKKVVIFPIAFTVDNSETVYELDIEYKEVAHELGFVDYRVCRCPNDSDLFVEALADIYTKMQQ